MIRFDNVEETRYFNDMLPLPATLTSANKSLTKYACCRKLLLDIQNIDHLLKNGGDLRNMQDCCSETETEGGGMSDNLPDPLDSPEVSKPKSSSNIFRVEESDEYVPLAKFVRENKNMSKYTHDRHINTSCNLGQVSSGRLQNSCYNQQSVGRKRARVVFSDDEDDEPDDIDQMRKGFHGNLVENVATSDKGWL